MELLAAGLYAVFVWWFSTGLILYLDGLPRTTHGWSLLAVTAIALAALVGLAASASDTTPLSAFIAFSCAREPSRPIPAAADGSASAMPSRSSFTMRSQSS
jgi:hypothetical protein